MEASESISIRFKFFKFFFSDPVLSVKWPPLIVSDYENYFYKINQNPKKLFIVLAETYKKI